MKTKQALLKGDKLSVDFRYLELTLRPCKGENCASAFEQAQYFFGKEISFQYRDPHLKLDTYNKKPKVDWSINQDLVIPVSHAREHKVSVYVGSSRFEKEDDMV
jgi:hypothetical protein